MSKVKIMLTEFLYFLLVVVVAFIFMVLLCRRGDAPDVFMFKILTSFTTMKAGRMFMFWGTVSLFIVTVLRQFKQKFKSIYMNILLSIAGLMLIFWFQNFAESINKIKSYYAKSGDDAVTTSLQYEVILLRCLQICILVLVVIAIIHLIRLFKGKMAR